MSGPENSNPVLYVNEAQDLFGPQGTLVAMNDSGDAMAVRADADGILLVTFSGV